MAFVLLRISRFNFTAWTNAYSEIGPEVAAATFHDFFLEKLQRAFTLANQLRWTAQYVWLHDYARCRCCWCCILHVAVRQIQQDLQVMCLSWQNTSFVVTKKLVKATTTKQKNIQKGKQCQNAVFVRNMSAQHLGKLSWTSSSECSWTKLDVCPFNCAWAFMGD